MKKKNLFTKSFAFVFSLALLGSCAVTGGEQGEGEWYGVGIDVDLSSRTNFLEGEKVDPSMFTLTAYEDGEEVTPDPNEVTIEPARSLTKEDKQLIFKWKKYTTTLDINVSDTMISECEAMDKAPFKYTELDDETLALDVGSDGKPKNRKAKKDGRNNDDGTLTSYLSEVSYGSNFSYSINTDNEGDELYIYASVASNLYTWGNVSEKYQSGFCGTGYLPLSNVIELSNNGKAAASKKTADIAATVVTEKDMDEHYTGKSIPWFTVLDLATRNFKRHWLGKITLEKGVNNIKIDFNGEKINGGSYAYKSLACGNWDNIEVHYVRKGEELKNGNLKIASYPKQEYIVGETFSLDGAYLYLEDDNGSTNDIDASKIVVSNTNPLSPKDTSIDLTYEGQTINIPIQVKSKIVGEVGLDNSPIKYVEPVHDRNTKNEVVGADATDVDTRKAKQSRTLTHENYLENVSAYSKFTYSYNSNKAGGKFDIYANVASNGSLGGDVSTVWPEAKGGFTASGAIDFRKFMELKNNDKSFSINEGALIPQTNLTSDMDPATIGQKEQVKSSAWGACTYFLLNNFRRIHIGTVDIVEGDNNIEISLGYNQGGFGYVNSRCGNWKNIEIIYLDDETDMSVASLKFATNPKTQYAIGETFSLDGAKIVAYNKDGIEIGPINNEEVEILDNSKLSADTTIRLKYKGIEFSIDVKVSNTVKQDFNKNVDVNSMNVKYVEMSTDSSKKANILDTYMEKVSKDSYFEFEFESDQEKAIGVSAEVATNAYLNKSKDSNYADYDTGIDGWTQDYIGSYDLDLSQSVKMTNTNGEETLTYPVNDDAIAKGHVIGKGDKDYITKTYGKDFTSKQWGIADDLCMKQFKDIELGEIKIKPGKNVIRLTMVGYLKKNSFAFEGYACGNWKSITLTVK